MRSFLLLLTIVFSSCQNQKRLQAQEAPSHMAFDQLLGLYVEDDTFNYRGLKKDTSKLNDYLKLLAAHSPGDDWTQNEQLAFWINAYNAFTLKLVIDNYPLGSITELHPTVYIPLVNTVWHKKFFEIGGKSTSLDEVEHKILRKKFNDPRIHFAINCASVSCPPLRKEAYLPHKIEQQLNEQAIKFINDTTRNSINSDRVAISKIFSWFSGDFTDEITIIDFLNQYSKIQISQNATIDYLDYDWRLNDSK